MKTFQQYINILEDDGSVFSGDADVFDVFELISSKFPKETAEFINKYSLLSGVNAPDGGFKDSDFSKERRRKKIVTKGLGDVSSQDAASGDDIVAPNSADSYHNPLG